MNEIDLSSNYFTGPIPSSLGKLHKLQYLYLDNNKFEARNSESSEIFFLKRGKSFAFPLIKKKRVAQLINGKLG
jgi:hypothetical protein